MALDKTFQGGDVRIVDDNGDPVLIGTVGTAYTEDAAAAANPVGPALILVRRDTLTTSEVSAENDNVAAKATSKGELRVSDADLNALLASGFETVAASQTAQVLGGSGAAADYISHILVVPATVSPGQVLLIDNATSITVFVGGEDSVLTLIPFSIPLGMRSASGAWKITTGTNVSVIAVGTFT